MNPVREIKVGDKFHPARVLYDERIKHWRYAKECDSVMGGMTESATLTLVELRNPITVPMVDWWFKLEVAGCSPPRYLKVSSEEIGQHFKKA